MPTFKKLLEKRSELQAEMEVMLTKAETEERALSEEEQNKFDSMESEIRAIDATIERYENSRKLEKVETKTEERAETNEVKAFENYLRGVVSGEVRSLDKGDNGAVIPATIAKQIIKNVIDRSPIFAMSHRYNVKGTLSVPYYDETEEAVTVDFVTNGGPQAKNGKFLSIDLKGYVAGALVLIDNALINNSEFDIVGFIVNEVSDKIAQWIDGIILSGAEDKFDALAGAKNVTEAAAATAVTADELIDVQESVPDAYQEKAIWVMHRTTRAAIRKLKDGDGNYLLNKDFTAPWGYTLLGKPVYVSDKAPKMGAGNAAIVYGDMSGLATKLANGIEISVLRERYAELYKTGVVAFLDFSAEVENQQKIAVLVGKK